MAAVTCPCCGSQIVDDRRVCIDDAGFIVAGGKIAALTETEYELFSILWRRRPRLITKAALFNSLYREGAARREPEPKIIDVIICNLRAKLKPLGIRIDTIWARGVRVAGRGVAP